MMNVNEKAPGRNPEADAEPTGHEEATQPDGYGNRSNDGAEDPRDTYEDPKTRTLRIWKEALQVQADNPRVFSELDADLARRAERGEYASAAHIAEFLRARVSDRDGADFRLNNDHIPVFSREATRRNPALKGHIELRRSRFDPLYPDARAGEVN